jgi:hypothetical protein
MTRAQRFLDELLSDALQAPTLLVRVMRIILNRHAVDHARAALAKWGHQ